MKKTIKLKRTYHLDVSASAPAEVRTLRFLEDGVECRWLCDGRIDVMPYGIFEAEGYSKPKDLSFPESVAKDIPENPLIPKELITLDQDIVQEILRTKDNQTPASSVEINVEEDFYEKVKKVNFIVNIPQEPIYFQEYNHRTIIGLFPQFATWDDNSVWEIQIIKITDKTIERTMVRTNPKELFDIVRGFKNKNKTPEGYLKDKVVRYLKDFFNYDRVSKEVFSEKYNEYLQKVSEVAGL